MSELKSSLPLASAGQIPQKLSYKTFEELARKPTAGKLTFQKVEFRVKAGKLYAVQRKNFLARLWERITDSTVAEQRQKAIEWFEKALVNSLMKNNHFSLERAEWYCSYFFDRINQNNKLPRNYLSEKHIELYTKTLGETLEKEQPFVEQHFLSQNTIDKKLFQQWLAPLKGSGACRSTKYQVQRAINTAYDYILMDILNLNGVNDNQDLSAHRDNPEYAEQVREDPRWQYFAGELVKYFSWLNGTVRPRFAGETKKYDQELERLARIPEWVEALKSINIESQNKLGLSTVTAFLDDFDPLEKAIEQDITERQQWQISTQQTSPSSREQERNGLHTNVATGISPANYFKDSRTNKALFRQQAYAQAEATFTLSNKPQSVINNTNRAAELSAQTTNLVPTSGGRVVHAHQAMLTEHNESPMTVILSDSNLAAITPPTITANRVKTSPQPVTAELTLKGYAQANAEVNLRYNTNIVTNREWNNAIAPERLVKAEYSSTTDDSISPLNINENSLNIGLDASAAVIAHSGVSGEVLLGWGGLEIKASGNAAAVAQAQASLTARFISSPSYYANGIISASASAFAGLQAKGILSVNHLKSKYAGPGISNNVYGSASLGLGANARLTAGVIGGKWLLVAGAGVTLGPGLSAGTMISVDPLAVSAALYERRAQWIKPFDRLRANRYEHLATKKAITQKLEEIITRQQRHIDYWKQRIKDVEEYVAPLTERNITPANEKTASENEAANKAASNIQEQPKITPTASENEAASKIQELLAYRSNVQRGNKITPISKPSPSTNEAGLPISGAFPPTRSSIRV